MTTIRNHQDPCWHEQFIIGANRSCQASSVDAYSAKSQIVLLDKATFLYVRFRV